VISAETNEEGTSGSSTRRFIYGLKRVCENREKKPQISPLRYAPVEMTILFKDRIPRFQERP
jgi:hypothetical protein